MYLVKNKIIKFAILHCYSAIHRLCMCTRTDAYTALIAITMMHNTLNKLHSH